ncbi:hypothetical protein LINPERPRIM_LOCUS20282 [Linum perenne]
MQGFNMALLGKQAWKLVSDPNALVCKILKAKYFPKVDFFSAELGNNLSQVWQSIHAAKIVINEGCRWKIGTGENVTFGAIPGCAMMTIFVWRKLPVLAWKSSVFLTWSFQV